MPFPFASQLAKPRRYEAAPQAEREAAELAECTFAPAVGRPPRTSSGELEREPAALRLYSEAQRRQAAREAAKRQLEEARPQPHACMFVCASPFG